MATKRESERADKGGRKKGIILGENERERESERQITVLNGHAGGKFD